MAKNIQFADDGWALWINGDDTSTVYLHEWINPVGVSYIDIGIRIRGVQETHGLNLYVPFLVEKDEVVDLSFHLQDPQIFRAIFDSTGLYEPMKNYCTSEIVYRGEVLDLVHLSAVDTEVTPCAEGTQITVSIDKILPYLNNDTAYFFFRLPHKNLTAMCMQSRNFRNSLRRMRDNLTSPIVLEKFGHSVRINEARMLPDDITKVGDFLRQKLSKAILLLSVHEEYQVNDSNCYRIQRLEEALYKNFAPKDFNCSSAITYQWRENREKNSRGHFNFYINIVREKISGNSMVFYLLLLVFFGAMGNALWSLLQLIWQLISG